MDQKDFTELASHLINKNLARGFSSFCMWNISLFNQIDCNLYLWGGGWGEPLQTLWPQCNQNLPALPSDTWKENTGVEKGKGRWRRWKGTFTRHNNIKLSQPLARNSSLMYLFRKTCEDKHFRNVRNERPRVREPGVGERGVIFKHSSMVSIAEGRRGRRKSHTTSCPGLCPQAGQPSTLRVGENSLTTS